MPPTNLSVAIAAFLRIPAIAQLYEEGERLYVEDLLTISAGKAKVGGAVAYRIYAAASSYLGAHPERFVDTHDGTKIGDWEKIIAHLDSIQAAEDSVSILPPVTSTVKFAPFATVSLRGFSEP